MAVAVTVAISTLADEVKLAVAAPSVVVLAVVRLPSKEPLFVTDGHGNYRIYNEDRDKKIYVKEVKRDERLT